MASIGWHMPGIAVNVVAGIVGGIVVSLVAGENDGIGNGNVNKVGISNW